MNSEPHKPPESTKRRRRDAMVLFSLAGNLFGIAADAVHEIRSADSLSGSAIELEDSPVKKVTHTVERGGKTYYIVSGSALFRLRRTRPTIVLILRDAPVGLLADQVENLVEIDSFYKLPAAYQGQERTWYRELAYFEDHVFPVVNPHGLLANDELSRLERAEQRTTIGAGEG